MNDIVTEGHLKNAQKLRALISKYQENRDLIMMGGYAQGQDPELDTAISIWPDILAFLRQDYKETVNVEDTQTSLNAIVGSL